MFEKPQHPKHILWLIGLGTALSLPGDATLYVTLPTHTAEAGIALTGVGLMLSANRWVRVLLNGPYGCWLDRLNRRPILIVSLFLGALSTLIYTAPGFWPLLVGRLLWGISWIGIWVGGNTAIMDIATDANRGRFSGQYQMWFFLGSGGSSLLGGVLTDWLGYRNGLFISASITLIGALLWLVFLPETRRSASPAPPDAALPDLLPPTTRSWRALIAAGAVFGVASLVFAGVVGSTLALLLEVRLGAVKVAAWTVPLATLTGVLIAAQRVLSMIAAPLAGWFSDRRGERWGAVMAALGAGAIATAGMGVASGHALIAAALLSAVMAGALQALVNALAGDHTPVDKRGSAIGLLNVFGDLGSAVGPMMAYPLLPVLGLSGLLGISALCMALMIGWVGFVAVSLRAEARLKLAPTVTVSQP